MKRTSFSGAFTLMIAFLVGTAAAQTRSIVEPGRADALVLNTDLVSVSISVTDQQGRYFTGLDRNAFAIFEDGVAQEIAFFGTDDGPASIGIVFDLSGSMKGERNQRAKEALTRFIQTGHADDEYSLVAFSDKTQTVLERVYDGEALARAINNSSSEGNTALFDAVATAIELVKKGRWSKRALVIISDGEDNRSRTTLRKLKQMVSEAGLSVYAVITEDSHLPRFWGAEDLRTLSTHTGGKAFTPETADQVVEVFDQIALEMRQRYSVGYAPTNVGFDGKWRNLKVKLAAPLSTLKLSVRAKAGYYAVASSPQFNKNGLTNANE
ncbi:MAG: VWA domain-containing protein [Acidobacteria bacterium]|nr:VWA domain-containing protein [Acidobacteriota bacterium]